MKVLLVIVLVVTLGSCARVKEELQELSTINCHMQSPVNIVPGREIGASHKVLVHYQTSKERVANLGHTVRVEYDSGSYLTYDGKDYQFKQFHFHTPSEHQVAGVNYPMEMHIVHTNEKSGTKEPEYCVVAVFFIEGIESDFLNQFLDAIPTEKEDIFETVDKKVNAAIMIPDELHQFYNYRGSLTTPPFTESVNWIVLKQPKTASKDQLEKIKSIEGNNARRIQFLYDRVIEKVN